jgi:hypothetical protein
MAEKEKRQAIFSLFQEILPIISQEWARTGSLASAKNFAKKKIGWQP